MNMDEDILHLKDFETSSIQGKLRIGAGSELSIAPVLGRYLFLKEYNIVIIDARNLDFQGCERTNPGM
jgi:hypothetical protein